MLFNTKIKLKTTLLLFLLFTFSTANADVPNYKISLSSGCSIKDDSKTKDNAVIHYLIGNWIINQLKKTNNKEKTIELTYDYQNFINNSKSTPEGLAKFKSQKTDDSTDKIKTDILNNIIVDYTKTVTSTPQTEEGNRLTITEQCLRLVPTSYPGIKETVLYEIKHVRPYNAPLQLAELRLNQGMETLVVMEYYAKDSKSKVRVINSGFGSLQNFSVKISGKELFTETILSDSQKEIITSQKTDNSSLETSEFSGLNTYPVRLLGRTSLITQ